MLMPRVTLQRELWIDGPSSFCSPRDISSHPQTNPGKVETKAGAHTLAHYLTDTLIKARVTQNAATRLSSQAEAEISQGSKTENCAGSRSRAFFFFFSPQHNVSLSPHPRLLVLWPNRLNIWPTCETFNNGSSNCNMKVDRLKDKFPQMGPQ